MKIMKKIIYIFICICLISLNHSCDKKFSSEQLQEIVDEYLNDKTNVLGSIVRVDIHGTESFEAVSGYIDSARTLPLHYDTKFPIASITKVFTSVLVHQLAEKGKVQLGDPLIQYLSSDWSEILEKIEFGDEVSIEQALSHRTGFADITEFEDLGDSLFSYPAIRLTPLDALKRVQLEGNSKFKPGANFDYCNINYILLGALIENVSGTSYNQALQENILNRIGLENTSLVEETIGSADGVVAHSYLQNAGNLNDGHNASMEWAMSAGGIISNADDLIKFYKALASGMLFDRNETYEEMCRLVGHNESYGSGLEVNEDTEIGLHYGHQGSLFNTRTLLMYFPEDQITISICHTFNGHSMLGPQILMKQVIQSITGVEPDDVDFTAGIDILADTSNVIYNEDEPVYGEWDFELKEVWSINRIGANTFTKPGKIHVDLDGRIYVFEQDSAKIHILDQEGKLLKSFGGYGDGQLFQYASDIYATSDHIHVMDMGGSNDKIKTFDKEGNFESAFNLDNGVTPRMFINKDQYVAVHSSSDIEERLTYEQLLLLSSDQEEKLVLGKIVADEKMVVSLNVDRGRIHHLIDDIEMFPRLIIHLNRKSLYLGRSDRYLIKKIDLQGKEELAFGISGRKRTSLPPGYAEESLSEIKLDGDSELPPDIKEGYLADFPEQLVFYTEITTDEQGLVYVFIPDIMNKGMQEIDIFSPEGQYLYHAVIKLDDDSQRVKPFAFTGKNLYAHVISKTGELNLVKYDISLPEYFELENDIKEEILEKS